MRGLYSERFHGEYDPTIRELKKSVVKRINEARRDKISADEIATAAGEPITIFVVYDMLNAELFPKEIWEAMDEGLERLGY